VISNAPARTGEPSSQGPIFLIDCAPLGEAEILSRRSFIQSTAAFGALAATGLARSLPTPAAATWESPPSIDNTGRQNVSAALSDWLASTGQDGDTFRLRRGAGLAPGAYWIPQGLRIDRPLTLDLRGCWLFTKAEDGSAFPPLWTDWGELLPGCWPKKRACMVISSSNVRIQSSVVKARIQGAARKAALRSGFLDLPSGCDYSATLEDQHGIRLSGMGTDLTDVTIDLSNISIEFQHGDGIYLDNNTRRTTITGRNLGGSIVGGEPAPRDPDYLGAVGGIGGTLTSEGSWVPEIATYPGIHHIGRHGIACGFSISDVLIDRISIWRVGRSIFDLEPAGRTSVVERVTIRNTEAGIHHLGWLAAAARSCNDITIDGNVCHENIQVTTDPTDPSMPLRHRNWKLLGNRGGLRKRNGAIFEVSRIDGLEIRDNLQAIDPNGRGVDPGNSTGVVIDPSESLQFPVAARPEG
jgi:hypothetical protein